MFNEEGETTWQRSLDSNNGAVKTGDNSSCPFLYQGQYYDAEIELAYNRFRYYSPEDGRYISQDPIGLHSDEFNFYAYVDNPTIGIDIFGLANSYRKKNGRFAKKPGRKSKNKKSKGEPNEKLLASAKRGREAHKNYENTLGGGYKFEQTLDNGKRVDAIDFKNNVVRELKPDTKSGLAKGKKQLADYVKQLESQTGETWTGVLDTYAP